MEQLTVNLGDRSYPITIAAGSLNDPASFWPLKKGDNVMLVTNDRIASLYLSTLSRQLNRIGIKFSQLILPDGEKYKSMEMLDRIFTALLTKRYDRDAIIIAFGGGTIGDLCGFAAASYKRGIRFIQVPTTLLAQVDSSIGGKTGINHSLGKNMIGAFHQPVSVIIDLNCLNTLSLKERSSGLAEVIKYGIVLDSVFFTWLEEHIEEILALEPQKVAYCIRRCCELKASVVSSDEREKGYRMILNLGHTYCHAIETHMGYGNWLHGEAVSAGIMMAVRAARRLGQFSKELEKRVSALLLRAGLPISGPREMTPEDYLLHMIHDKKAIKGKICLVLPITLGNVEVRIDIADEIVLASIKDIYVRNKCSLI